MNDNKQGVSAEILDDIPQYTRAPRVEEDEELPIRRRGPGRPRKDDSEKESFTINACGAVVGIPFKLASIALAGNLALGLSDEERRRLGSSFKKGLERLPGTSLLVKAIDWVAPWADLVDGLLDAIHERFVRILRSRNAFIAAQIQAQEKQQQERQYLDEEA